MGGHDAIPPVPDYKIYKAEDVPELRKLQQRLAKHGLKDPWIRNHVWRFNPGWGAKTRFGRLFEFMFRGFLKVGLPAFLVTVVVNETMMKKDEHHDEGSHH